MATNSYPGAMLREKITYYYFVDVAVLQDCTQAEARLPRRVLQSGTLPPNRLRLDKLRRSYEEVGDHRRGAA